jgi:hypothetical protein
MLTLDIYDTDRGDTGRLELRQDTTDHVVDLRPAEGASAIEILLRQDDATVYWGEVPCEPDIPVRVRLFRAGDEWLAASPSNTVYRLDTAKHRRRPLLSRADTDAVDLVFLVDGTARDYERVPEQNKDGQRVSLPRLLPDSKAWKTIAGECSAMADVFAQRGAQVRWAVLAFGDHILPWVTTLGDLRPAYAVHPDESARRLSNDLTRLVPEGLMGLRGTSGCDFVDALADGLQAAGRFNWRTPARHLLVVIGDSPGYSVVPPPPPLANAQARSLDVYSEAARLHDQAVEIVTIFHDIGASPGQFAAQDPGPMLSYARQQYERLASARGYALLSSRFRGGELAENLWSARTPLAHGAFPGVATR